MPETRERLETRRHVGLSDFRTLLAVWRLGTGEQHEKMGARSAAVEKRVFATMFAKQGGSGDVLRAAASQQPNIQSICPWCATNKKTHV